MNLQLSPTSENQPFVLIPFFQNDFLKDNIQRCLDSKNASNLKTIVGDFKADLKELNIVPTAAGKIVLLGLGKAQSHQEISTAFRSCISKLIATLPESIGVDFSFISSDLRDFVSEAAVNGISLGTYKIGLYKTDAPAQNRFNLEKGQIYLQALKELTFAEKGAVLADTQKRIFDLVNAPANYKKPKTMADWAIESGKKYGYKVEIFDTEKCLEMGLHAVLAVGQGSSNPPYFIVMEYERQNLPDDAPTIALVGKGVVFDTGGISIKDSANMHYMKSDMGGAAAVFGAMEATARLNLPIRLKAVVPAVENAIGENAVKPGDVIGSYAGKTIEVIDTDAEGRLILADGLSYAVRQFKPDYLIDLATLTGSCVQTLGYGAGGLFCNNDELVQSLAACGDKSGERVWRLPLWDIYAQEIKSDVADLKNYHNKPIVGAIAAAKFLEVFTDGHSRWAHIDMAAMAFADSEFSSMKSATAYGVKLLTDFFKKFEK